MSPRLPRTTPDAREAAAQENDARRVAEAVSGASPAYIGTVSQSYLSGPQNTSVPVSVGTRVPVVPVAADVEGSLREASMQIARAYARSEPSPADMRAGSEAYRAEAAARDELARQQQGNGTRTMDVMA